MGLWHKGFLSPCREGARWYLRLGAAHPLGLVSNKRPLPRAPKGCNMAIRLFVFLHEPASNIEGRIVRPESKE